MADKKDDKKDPKKDEKKSTATMLCVKSKGGNVLIAGIGNFGPDETRIPLEKGKGKRRRPTLSEAQIATLRAHEGLKVSEV